METRSAADTPPSSSHRAQGAFRTALPLILGIVLPLLLLTTAAADEPPTPAALAERVQANHTALDFVWTLVAAFLVFFMQAGFAMVEVGFTRAKNATNIMMKNLLDFAVGTLAFWAVGFGLMFGPSMAGLLGTGAFFLSGVSGDPWTFAFWMFQVVFCATAATIVSGAMAERTKFGSYVVYSLAVSAFIYPVFGGWAWGGLFKGGGWLENLGFVDFAGSSVVHSVGGWCALAGAIVLGPRIGKYNRDGSARAIPGHNMPLAALGVLILWFGWFGFNAGSTTSAHDLSIAAIAANTNLAAAAGAVAAAFTSWRRFRVADASMSLNGALAGLVAITAGCANVSHISAVIIGLAAGVIVVYAVTFIEQRLRVDDPVGAISVHGVCGAWGTMAAGLFNAGGVTLAGVGVQALGVISCFAWAFGAALLLFRTISATVGLRVPAEEELRGLDLGEHRTSAYPEFLFTTPK